MFGYIHVRCDTKESSLRFSLSSTSWVFVETLLVVHSLLTTSQHRSTAHFQPQRGSGASCTESCWKQDFIVLVSIEALTIPMSEDEEVLDNFLVRDPISLAEYSVGACPAEYTNYWTISGITPKIPPSCDGTTSWFKYEELIEDWPDVRVLDTRKQGPALKNKLHGNAEKYRGLLNRDAVKAEDGDKYFRDKLRPHSVKGAYSVFLWRFGLLNRASLCHL